MCFWSIYRKTGVINWTPVPFHIKRHIYTLPLEIATHRLSLDIPTKFGYWWNLPLQQMVIKTKEVTGTSDIHSGKVSSWERNVTFFTADCSMVDVGLQDHMLGSGLSSKTYYTMTAKVTRKNKIKMTRKGVDECYTSYSGGGGVSPPFPPAPYPRFSPLRRDCHLLHAQF